MIEGKPCEPLKIEKHMAITNSMENLRDAVFQLSQLPRRIENGPCGEGRVGEDKPIPSLSMVLDMTPSEIDELSERILKTKAEIEQLLFG